MKNILRSFLLLACVLLMSVDVVAANVKFEWTPPTERESCDVKAVDGTCVKYTPLAPSEIGGYHIYYSTTKGAYNNQFDINDGTATSTVVDLPRGFIYFAVITTFDIDNLESIHSEFISVAVDHGAPKSSTNFRATVLPD